MFSNGINKIPLCPNWPSAHRSFARIRQSSLPCPLAACTWWARRRCPDRPQSSSTLASSQWTFSSTCEFCLGSRTLHESLAPFRWPIDCNERLWWPKNSIGISRKDQRTNLAHLIQRKHPLGEVVEILSIRLHTATLIAALSNSQSSQKWVLVTGCGQSPLTIALPSEHVVYILHQSLGLLQRLRLARLFVQSQVVAHPKGVGPQIAAGG